jgi:mono/diheme cytochrome c family protein
MRRRIGLTAVVTACWCALAFGDSEIWQATRAASDGVYAPGQAARGRQTYRRACAYCHLDDLTGDGLAPELTGARFVNRWIDRTAEDLVATIAATMPQDEPGTLSRQASVDVVAYLLEANDFPAGTVELPSDAQQLRAIALRAR